MSVETISVGDVFDTPFETGCLAVGELDDFGSFDGLDSDGVLCRFVLPMVEQITGTREVPS